MLLNTLRPSRDDSVFFAKDVGAFLPCRVGDELFHSPTRKMRHAAENQQLRRKKGRKRGNELHAARNQQQPGRNCRKELRAGYLLLFHWARKKGSFIIYPCLGFPMRLETTGLAGLAAPCPRSFAGQAACWRTGERLVRESRSSHPPPRQIGPDNMPPGENVCPGLLNKNIGWLAAGRAGWLKDRREGAPGGNGYG